MSELALDLAYWHWLALGIIFVTVEVFVPGGFFLGMGLSGLVVGVTVWLAPTLDWKIQMVVFGVLSLVSVVALRQWLKSRPIESEQPLLNQRGLQYVGRTFTLEQAIVDGQGKIRVDDSTWKVRGNDQPAGSKVVVKDADGVVLLVETAGE